jgi:hypothetical protein
MFYVIIWSPGPSIHAKQTTQEHAYDDSKLFAAWVKSFEANNYTSSPLSDHGCPRSAVGTT